MCALSTRRVQRLGHDQGSPWGQHARGAPGAHGADDAFYSPSSRRLGRRSSSIGPMVQLAVAWLEDKAQNAVLAALAAEYHGAVTLGARPKMRRRGVHRLSDLTAPTRSVVTQRFDAVRASGGLFKVTVLAGAAARPRDGGRAAALGRACCLYPCLAVAGDGVQLARLFHFFVAPSRRPGLPFGTSALYDPDLQPPSGL